MITIKCPENNWVERSYIIDVLFGGFLGISYKLESNPKIKEYKILLENRNEVIIEDHFFSHFNEDLAYLNHKNLPTNVSLTRNQFLAEYDIPVIYGTDNLVVSENPNGIARIVCGLDIFASSFLMLTRWEEYVSEEKDPLNRFSANSSLAYKYNFLNRPIVNEYTELLWNMLKYAGIKQIRKVRHFKPYITHDVDFIRKWNNLIGFVRILAGDIFKKHSIKAFLSDLHDFSLTKLNLKKDPYDTFDYLMSLSEKNGFQSYFFFMSVQKRNQIKHYNLSNKIVKDLIQKIRSRGHKIGFHPDLNSYNNQERWKSEFEKLKSLPSKDIIFGRQHYLQFEAPTTWQIWDEMGMKWDSTLSFNDDTGFRTGCCYSYPTFNFLERKRLKLIERPLIIMDKALVMKQKGLHYTDIERKSKLLIDKVQKYEGEFVLLWHNSCFNVREWKEFDKLYAYIVGYLSDAA